MVGTREIDEAWLDSLYCNAAEIVRSGTTPTAENMLLLA